MLRRHASSVPISDSATRACGRFVASPRSLPRRLNSWVERVALMTRSSSPQSRCCPHRAVERRSACRRRPLVERHGVRGAVRAEEVGVDLHQYSCPSGARVCCSRAARERPCIAVSCEPRILPGEPWCSRSVAETDEGNNARHHTVNPALGLERND
jgi:hypothetical protein